jgi:5-methylcytosine-specific restriction endonuclease McrA
MPYFLETDTFHDLPAWEVLADGVGDVVDQLQAAYTRMKSKTSHLLSEGYLTEGAALAMCRGRRKILDKLCTPVLGDQPLLHRQGDECECLGDSWTAGYAYRVHNFLKRNPSRREYNRNRAQKADLRDARLKGMVYRRDGGCCRYCASGPLSPKAVRAKDRRKVLHYDHVDPDQPATPDGGNFVVACGRCNEAKGKRTPYEADMPLLPEPTPEQAAALERRPLQLLDPAGDHRPTGAQPATDHRITDQNTDHDQKPVSDPVGDPITDRHHDPIADPAPPVRPSPTTPATDQPPAQPPEPSGMGRGGTPDPIPAGSPYANQENRLPENPDVYHRRSRLPDPPPFISAEPEWPPTTWPAGSVPVRSPEEP